MATYIILVDKPPLCTKVKLNHIVHYSRCSVEPNHAATILCSLHRSTAMNASNEKKPDFDFLPASV